MGCTGRVLQCVLHLNAAPPIYYLRVYCPAEMWPALTVAMRECRTSSGVPFSTRAGGAVNPSNNKAANRAPPVSQIPRSQVVGQAARCMWLSRAVAHLHTCGRAGVGPISWYLHHLDFTRQAHNIIVIVSVSFSKKLCARVLPFAVQDCTWPAAAW